MIKIKSPNQFNSLMRPSTPLLNRTINYLVSFETSLVQSLLTSLALLKKAINEVFALENI